MKNAWLVSLLATSIVAPATFAQDSNRPLIWGADPDGGIPYVFADPEHPAKFIGVEVDIKDALSKQMGRPIALKKREFDSLINDVERGDIDFAMNGLEILPDRLARVQFTKPYYLYQLQLVVRADSKIQTLEEVAANNLVVGTLGATAAERLLNDEHIAVKTYNDQNGPYKNLSLGREVQAVLLDLPAAIYYASPDRHLKYARSNEGLRFAGSAFAEGYYGIAVRKDNLALLAELNQAIDSLRDSGELKTILQKWELWNTDQYRLAKTQSVEADDSGMPFAEFFPLLVRGAWFTVLITFAGMLLAVLLGLPISLARLYGPAPLRWLAIMYVEFFRGIPVLLLLYFLYYGLPTLNDTFSLNAYVAAILGFGLNYAAYEAEIYRAGIASIPAGQWEAAASLGMSPPLTFRRVILPQAIRVILPPMTNDLVALFKDTSVVSIIGVVELSKEYQILTKSGGGFLQIGLTTAVLYLIMSVPLGYLSRYLEHRWGTK